MTISTFSRRKRNITTNIQETIVEIGYIQCPACQRRAVFSVTTPQIRVLQKRIRGVKNQYAKAKRLKKAERLLTEYFNLKERIGLLMPKFLEQLEQLEKKSQNT
ncbi:hypothetical protein DT075_27815 [Bacillus licheniformis]|nr:hypothetical protein DT075_27815 [Bacillus licheniformis]